MKVLIQHRKTLMYLQNDGTWTANLTEARDFGNSARAVEHAATRGFVDVQVVLKFPDGDYDITLPMSKGCRRPRRKTP